MPALLTGFALAFARGFGEYGSVVFIAGNQPMKTEIVPLIINSKLRSARSCQGATVVAALMLVSFLSTAVVDQCTPTVGVGLPGSLREETMRTKDGFHGSTDGFRGTGDGPRSQGKHQVHRLTRAGAFLGQPWR